MPEPPITYKNSFNAGDLITMMPGMQRQFDETGKKAVIFQRLGLLANYDHGDFHPIKDEAGQNVCMNEQMLSKLTPLIEAQEYVESFKVWQGEKVDVDFDTTRWDSRVPLSGGLIHKWVSLIFPQLECDLSVPWLRVKKNGNLKNKIIINRTARYNNPYTDYFFLKDHQDKTIFAGTELEHKTFCEQFKINIPLLIVKDFLELTEELASCLFFVGNQSLCWHICDAIKQKRILEVCAFFPNTFPNGANGYSFVAQNSLEHLFNKLLKETKDK